MECELHSTLRYLGMFQGQQQGHTGAPPQRPDLGHGAEAPGATSTHRRLDGSPGSQLVPGPKSQFPVGNTPRALAEGKTLLHKGTLSATAGACATTSPPAQGPAGHSPPLCRARSPQPPSPTWGAGCSGALPRAAQTGPRRPGPPSAPSTAPLPAGSSRASCPRNGRRRERHRAGTAGQRHGGARGDPSPPQRPGRAPCAAAPQTPRCRSQPAHAGQRPARIPPGTEGHRSAAAARGRGPRSRRPPAERRATAACESGRAGPRADGTRPGPFSPAAAAPAGPSDSPSPPHRGAAAPGVRPGRGRRSCQTAGAGGRALPRPRPRARTARPARSRPAGGRARLSAAPRHSAGRPERPPRSRARPRQGRPGRPAGPLVYAEQLPTPSGHRPRPRRSPVGPPMPRSERPGSAPGAARAPAGLGSGQGARAPTNPGARSRPASRAQPVAPRRGARTDPDRPVPARGSALLARAHGVTPGTRGPGPAEQALRNHHQAHEDNHQHSFRLQEGNSHKEKRSRLSQCLWLPQGCAEAGERQSQPGAALKQQRRFQSTALTRVPDSPSQGVSGLPRRETRFLSLEEAVQAAAAAALWHSVCNKPHPLRVGAGAGAAPALPHEASRPPSADACGTKTPLAAELPQQLPFRARGHCRHLTGATGKRRGGPSPAARPEAPVHHKQRCLSVRAVPGAALALGGAGQERWSSAPPRPRGSHGDAEPAVSGSAQPRAKQLHTQEGGRALKPAPPVTETPAPAWHGGRPRAGARSWSPPAVSGIPVPVLPLRAAERRQDRAEPAPPGAPVPAATGGPRKSEVTPR
ncbi:basic proline-rich protein-like [Neopsephotus bourkii]|uniref:basic proline-rich protein-like n=1 Tax=Neopsephotus bourkii TaxID=309878 RepID=UPI002AA5A4E6|nr:basic proline-rich protein-like [Neopsephotus bourkii]